MEKEGSDQRRVYDMKRRKEKRQLDFVCLLKELFSESGLSFSAPMYTMSMQVISVPKISGNLERERGSFILPFF